MELEKDKESPGKLQVLDDCELTDECPYGYKCPCGFYLMQRAAAPADDGKRGYREPQIQVFDSEGREVDRAYIPEMWNMDSRKEEKI